jgi:hypothetical protein
MQLQSAVKQAVQQIEKTGLATFTGGDQLVVVARRSLEPKHALDDQRLAASSFVVGSAERVRPVQVRLVTTVNALDMLCFSWSSTRMIQPQTS